MLAAHRQRGIVKPNGNVIDSGVFVARLLQL